MFAHSIYTPSMWLAKFNAIFIKAKHSSLSQQLTWQTTS